MARTQTSDTRRLVDLLQVWFEQNARDLPWRREPTPYRVWISEIMLQQTQVATVIPYFERFMARFPDLKTLAAAGEQDVLALWSGLGYYRRARMLHEAACEIVENHGGEFPNSRDALLALPGIGRYTAGAILSIAFNQPEPIVDGNVERVFARMTREKRPIKGKFAQAAAWLWATALAQSSGANPRVLNQALMEWGATVCTPLKPRCESCPLARQCAARKHGDAAKYPRVEKRPALKSIRYIAWLKRDKRGRVLLTKRGAREASLLPDGLWELPHTEFNGSQGRKAPVEAQVVRQTIMNWKVELEVRNGTAPGEREGEQRWFETHELASLPMASITRKALQLGR